MTSPSTHDALEYGRRAVDTLEGARIPTANTLHRAAHVLEDKAQNWERGKQAARGLHNAAHYVRDHDVDAIRSDVERAVRLNPGYALAAAAGFGFLLGRFLSRR
jgi:ElaB/YqjD/DUF883 family membrane-anchored ribosome-binding protein